MVLKAQHHKSAPRVVLYILVEPAKSLWAFQEFRVYIFFLLQTKLSSIPKYNTAATVCIICIMAYSHHLPKLNRCGVLFSPIIFINLVPSLILTGLL